MSTVDKRIVQLDFDNAGFEEKAKQTLRVLDDMKKGFQFKNASTGLDDISAKASSFNLNALTSAAEAVNKRFSAMGTFTSRIIENIADTAYKAGSKIANFIASPVTNAVNQIKTGGWARAAKLEQAKFTMSNLGEEWGDWSEAIDYGVAGTAYGLDQGAMVASKLIASGIRDTEDMKMILKGIAGTASTFSAEYERVADVVQDSISQGVVMNGELQRLSDMGIPAAEMLAKYLGVTVEEVREMASDRQISGMKLVAALFKEYGDSADKANKTFDGALTNLKAGFSKIGEKFATPLRNNMRDLFNTLRVAVNTIKDQIQPIVDVVEDKMKKVFGWLINMLGGTDEAELKKKWGEFQTVFNNVADALENLWIAAERIVKPIAEAFKEVFPPATIDTLNDGTKAFADFTKTLAISKKTQNNIKTVFITIFTTLRDIKKIIKQIIGQIRPALNSAWTGLKKIYAYIQKLAKSFETGGFDAFFKTLQSGFASIPAQAKEAADGFMTFLESLPGVGTAIEHFKQISEFISNLTSNLPSLSSILSTVITSVTNVFGWIADKLKPFVGTSFTTLWNDIKDGFAQVTSFIKGESENLDLGSIMSKIGKDVLNLASDIVAAVTEALSGIWNWITTLPIDWNAIGKSISSFVGGIVDGFVAALSAVTIDFGGILEAFTNNPVVTAISDFFDKTFGITKSNTKKANDQNAEAMKSGTVLKNSAEQLAEDTEESFGVFDAIKNAISTVKDGGMAALIVAASRVVWNIAGLVKSGASALSGISKIFKSVAKENKAVARNLNAEALKKVAIAIAIFAASILVLAMLPTSKMLTAATVLLTFTFTMAIIIGILSIATETGSSVMSSLKTKIADAIAGFFDKIKKLAGIGILVAGIGVGLYLIVKTIQMVAGIDYATAKKGVSAIVGILAGIVVTCAALSKFAPKLSTGTAATILAIAVGIVILQYAIKKLGSMILDKKGNITKSGIAKLVAGVVAVGVLLVAIGAMARIAKNCDIEGSGKAILAMSIGMFVMAKAVKTIGELGLGKMVIGLIAVIGLLAAFTAAAILLSKFKVNAFTELGKLALGMVTVAAGVYVLGSAFAAIIKAVAPIGGLGGLLGVAAIFAAFIAAMVALAKWGGQGTAVVFIEIGVSMVALAIAVWTLVDAIRAASEVGWEGLGSAIGVFAVALLTLVGVAAAMIILSPLLGAAGTLILPFAISCVAIAAAVWLVVDALETVMTSPVFEGFRKAIGDLYDFVMGKIAPMVDTLKGAMDMFSGKLTEDKDNANMQTVRSYLEVMDKVNQGLIDGNSDMVKSLRAVAEDAAVDLGYDSLNGLINTLADGEGELEDAATHALRKFVEAERTAVDAHSDSRESIRLMDDIINGLLHRAEDRLPEMYQSGIKVAGTWMSGISSPFTEGGGADSVGNEAVSQLLGSLTSGNIDMSSAAGMLGSAVTGSFGDNLDLSGVMSGDLSSMMGSISEQYPEISSMFDSLGGDLGQSVIGSWQDQDVSGALSSMLGDTSAIYGENQESFIAAGSDVMSALTDGFEAGEPLIYDATSNVVQTVGDAFTDGASSESFTNAAAALPNAAVEAINSSYTNFSQAGTRSVIGFSEGVLLGIPFATTACATMANAAKNAVSTVLGIHSPSRVFMNLGRYSIEGYALALTKYAPIVGEAASGVATTALDSVNNALSAIPSTIGNSNAFNPVVTPIMDLSNIQNGANSISGMFSDTTLGVGGITGDVISGNLSGLSSLANAFNANKSNNDDVVNAISDLNSEINTMANKMTSLQVRMDSGALVGSISGKMDSALGGIAKRRGRSG